MHMVGKQGQGSRKGMKMDGIKHGLADSAPGLDPAAIPFREVLPVLLQDVTLMLFSVSFPPEAAARRLPPGLIPAGEGSGGVEILVAPRSPFHPAYAEATVWIDLTSPHPDKIAPRFVLSRHVTRDLDLAVQTGTRIRLVRDDDLHQVEVEAQGQSVIRATMRCAAAGEPGAALTIWHEETGRRVVPWAARLADADPVSLDLTDPALADLHPFAVFGAALGSCGTATLGIHLAPVSEG